MNKQITLEQAVEKVHDGMTIMFGGFLGVGSATQIIDAIVEKGVKDLTIIGLNFFVILATKWLRLTVAGKCRKVL